MSVIRAAALAGVAGTGVEALATFLQRRTVGASPLEPAALAERLLSEVGVHLSEGQARAAGTAMRWTYGPSWGVPAAVAARRLAWPLSGLLVGAALFGFELLMLPASGAAPPVRRWGGRFVALDAANSLLYGLVATRLWLRLDSGGSR